MSGIIGYRGSQPAAEVLLGGLRRMEPRGYDSAGLAINSAEGLVVHRVVGRVDQLAGLVESGSAAGRVGIAHTRWATHGRPKLVNAHPHRDVSGRLALVHNGVIENHQAIRAFLAGQGIGFSGETDSETLVQLVGFFLSQTGDLLESVRGALRQVRGAYGIALVSSEAPETLIAARRGSPLIVAMRGREGMITSDPAALPPAMIHATELDENELAWLDPEGFRTTTIDLPRATGKGMSDFEAGVASRMIFADEVGLSDAALGGFRHHMQKEIFEQPESLRNTLRGRIREGDDRVKLAGMDRLAESGPRIRRVLIFGCGTSWHAGLVGRSFIEELAGVPVVVDYASELRYRNILIEEGTLAIAMSASGETEDTIGALREVVLRGARSLGIVGEIGSTISRQTEAGVYLHVGPEIGVASTKAFTGQLAALALVALDLGRRRQLAPAATTALMRELDGISERVAESLELDESVRELAGEFAGNRNWLVLGQGINLPVALEGALKLKEVGGVHAEGMPAAEMKHGPIAMIDAGMPVVVIAPRDRVARTILANIREVRARGGRVIAIATTGDAEIAEAADFVLFVPDVPELLSPIVTTIPIQLLAYHTAVARGLDVDKTRD